MRPMHSQIHDALRRMHTLLVPACLTLLSGCGMNSSYGEPSTPSAYSASSFSGAPSSSVVAVPSREVTAGGFVARPDTIVMPFALHVVHNDVNEAITLLRKTTGELATQAKTVAGASAVVRMRGISVSAADPDKASDSESGAVSVMVDGVIDAPLAPELDFWERARLFANLSALIKSREKSGKAEMGEVTARCDSPKIIVKNPEAYRLKLTEEWVKRARELAKLAEQAAVPLYLVDCEPPGEIVQTFISFEEVGLSLKATCRLDAVSPSGPRSPPGAEPGK